MKTSSIFDGELHSLLPEEDFMPAPGVIDRWVIEPDREELSPYEAATLVPKVRNTGSPLDPRFPEAPLNQGWGAMSVVLSAMCTILDVGKQQYQRNSYDKKTGKIAQSEYTFQTKNHIGDRI